MRWVPCAAVVVLVAAPLAVRSLPSARGDEEVAKFLLSQAKKAVATRDYVAAIQKLERVREEDPKLLEAIYLLGQVYEKKKVPEEALGAYRAFRDACRALGERLERSDERLLVRALKRIRILGKGEAELETLEEEFADEIHAFARKHEQADSDIAVDALRRLLEVQPGDEEAKRQLVALGERADAKAEGMDPAKVPIPGITKWVDMLAKKSIPAGDKTSYDRKVLTFDATGGSVFWTDPTVSAPDVFVYDMEFRFLKDHAVGYLLGLAFAQDEEAMRAGSNEFVMAFAQRSEVTMAQASGRKNLDIGQTTIHPIHMDTWHRLTLAVEGRKARVYFDGKKVLSSSVPGRKSLAGPVGIFHQRCVAEVRVLRLGTKP